MSKTNKDIQNHFGLFTELAYNEKIAVKNIIQLEQKKNNVRWKIGQSEVQHKTIKESILLIVEKSKRDSKYGIKLLCPSFTNEPFFRFDSDGPTHRNTSPNIPLEDQPVTTPHFNSFKEDGRPIAYKNEAIINEKNSKKIAEDINFGVSLFCIETNTKLSNGAFPIIADKEPELEFNQMQNINFDNISFE